jgi:hypothetical protein
MVCRDLIYATGDITSSAKEELDILVTVQVIVEEKESEKRLADGCTLANTLLPCDLRLKNG